MCLPFELWTAGGRTQPSPMRDGPNHAKGSCELLSTICARNQLPLCTYLLLQHRSNDVLTVFKVHIEGVNDSDREFYYLLFSYLG